MKTDKGNWLQQAVASDLAMREIDAKRDDVFARLRALGCEVSMPTHDTITLVAPPDKRNEAYEIIRELLPSGEFRFLDPHKKEDP